MDKYVDLCHLFGLPVWIASLLNAAKCRKNDCARRKKAYRLLQRTLIKHRIGVEDGNLRQPTYVYPKEVKMLIRSAFSKNVCDYPDPCHDQVVNITMDDLHKVEIQ
ncbi:coiled-coil-helix-coiled-coil-helix domain-containing protein 7 isoform X1 [Xyrichtys novacula]|uniref:Coiled-coil-helix-coiled-coil-helix domain-containing protein 7 isoform X1 n=1 Tax=Xyrichtys novacula TaxID=13765 RepID=A0AAV1H7H7_XYRNO|nr:coiled-coil-helix-coiled-coil-helix domain-containing protein 7 isoform X1 [Xyrichtys novacula]